MRATQNAGIRTQYLHYEGQEAKAILVQNAEHDEQRMTTDQNQTIATHNQHRTDRTQAPLWHEDDFVSGHVQTAIQYWKETILTAHPQRDECLGYIGGLRLNDFNLYQQVFSKVTNLKGQT